MRIVILCELPDDVGATRHAEDLLRLLLQQAADKLRRGGSIKQLASNPPRDPNRTARVTIEVIDEPDEFQWTDKEIDRLLDELDRQAES